MPLKLALKPGEKIFIGGAVIQNGNQRAELTLLNDAAVLRQSDILTESTADTLCKKLYLLVQLMYMDTANLPDYHAKFWVLAKGISNELKGAAELIDAIGQEVVARDNYRALKVTKKLIALEKEGR